jgi:hypothetical protein
MSRLALMDASTHWLESARVMRWLVSTLPLASPWARDLPFP